MDIRNLDSYTGDLTDFKVKSHKHNENYTHKREEGLLVPWFGSKEGWRVFSTLAILILLFQRNHIFFLNVWLHNDLVQNKDLVLSLFYIFFLSNLWFAYCIVPPLSCLIHSKPSKTSGKLKIKKIHQFYLLSCLVLYGACSLKKVQMKSRFKIVHYNLFPW